MTSDEKIIQEFAEQEYKYGWVSDIESDTLPPGLDEEVIRHISARKEEPEWLLEFRLKAFRRWQKMDEPHWPKVDYGPIYRWLVPPGLAVGAVLTVLTVLRLFTQ